MRRILLIAASVSLALWLGGCSSGEEGGDTVSQASPDAASEQSQPAESGASPTPGQTPNAQPAAATQTRPSNRPRGILPTDLIRSTSSDQRLRDVQSNRPDPFSQVPSSPRVTITRVNPPAVAPSSSPAASRPAERTRVQPSPAPEIPEIPRLPRVLPPATAALEPQPEVARAVSVSGVVQIGGTVYAIVDAPNEPSSRYVQVGQRLSNGEVLVRRINFNGSDSSVLLEQSGMQVVRRVGEAPILPVAPAQADAPAA